MPTTETSASAREIRERALPLALRGGEHLLAQAVVTAYGTRFRAAGPAGEPDEHPMDLFRGAAGVGRTLLEFFRHTGRAGYLDLAREIHFGLVECTPERFDPDPSLYEGHAGVALFQLALAEATGDAQVLEVALRLARRLGRAEFRETDLIGGAAGTGLVLLAFHAARGNDEFLAGARRAAAYLHERAIVDGAGRCWEFLGTRQRVPAERQYGLSHGTAGVCVFLFELAQAGKDRDALADAEAGLAWLTAAAQTRGDGVEWPVGIGNPEIRAHWCHGSVGIAQAYLAAHRATGDEPALETAARAARAGFARLGDSPDEPPIHCHGIAGLLELALDLVEHGMDVEGLRLASGAFRRLEAIAGPGRAPSALGADQPGFSLGTAGIARVLLRLGGGVVRSPLVPGAAHPEAGSPLAPSLVPPADSTFTPASADAPAPPFFPASGPHAVRLWSDFLAGSAAGILPMVVGTLAERPEILVPIRFVDATRDADFVGRFAADPRSTPYFDALERVLKGCAELEEHHGERIAPGALGPSVGAGLFRQIAGACLLPSAPDRNVARTARHWSAQLLRSLELMFLRLAEDLPSLRANGSSGRVLAVSAHESDPHRDGQRVFELRFESGPAFLYKSRSVAIERHLVGRSLLGEPPSLAERMHAWLDPSFEGAGLATHRVVDSGPHHGWVEKIETALEEILRLGPERIRCGESDASASIRAHRLPPGAEDGFWYDAGLTAGFAVGLGISDLHSENLLCGRDTARSRPALHLIDLEYLFQPVDTLLDTMLVDLTEREKPHVHAQGGHQHEGLEREPRLCGFTGEAWMLLSTPDGLKAVARREGTVRTELPHLVRNDAGSCGYGAHLAPFLRGLADLWECLRAHAPEVRDHLRERLTGAPARVLLKATHEYDAPLRRRALGGPPVPGACAYLEERHADPLCAAELRQLDNLDVPYFFEKLGTEGLFCFEGAPTGGGMPIPQRPPRLAVAPFWTIVDRQTRPETLARTLADAALFVAPDAPFDLTVPELGVRVCRNADDPRTWIVVHLRASGRMTCRVEGRGKMDVWFAG